MDKYEVLDKFQDKLTKRFICLCDGNDFAKINLLLIGDTIDEIYEEVLDELRKEDGEK